MGISAGNSTAMKQKNQKAILHTLYYRTASRSELAKILGITRASVSDHVDELINFGIVAERGAGIADIGRKPTLLDIAPSYAYFGGLYISRGDCVIGFTDMKGKLIRDVHLPMSEKTGPDELLKKSAEVLSELFTFAGIEKYKVISVGVSVPGPVDSHRGLILSPPKFDNWKNYPIAEKLGQLISLPVLVENNAASLTLAEMRLGYGRKYNSFIFLVVDSGIGGGIVVNGSLYKGFSGFGSEIGHNSIDWQGRLCSCGNRGCLECYASIPAILGDSFMESENIRSWRQVADLAEVGEIRCMEAIKREADYLAAALVNCVNTFEPEACILSGDIAYKPEMLLNNLRDRVNNMAMMRGSRPVGIYIAQQSGAAGAAAAASIAIDDFFREK